MIVTSKFGVVISLVILMLSTTACGQSIEADFCVGIMNDQSGFISPEDNAFFVSTIDSVLLPLGYEKKDAPAITEYEKSQPQFSNVNILKNMGRLGTMIVHFPSPNDNSYTEGKAAIILAIDNEITPKYIVRNCEDISSGSTPKLYN